MAVLNGFPFDASFRPSSHAAAHPPGDQGCVKAKRRVAGGRIFLKKLVVENRVL
jgi:hypothetical protein